MELDVTDILATVRVGHWRLDMEDYVPVRLYSDEIMDNLLGIPHDITPEERVARFLKGIHPDDNIIFDEYNHNLFLMERAEIVYRYIHPEKGITYARCSGQGLVDENGKKYVLGIHQDVTDTIRVEREYQKRNVELEAALGVEYEAVFSADLDDNIIRTIRNSARTMKAGFENSYTSYDNAAQLMLWNFFATENHKEYAEQLRLDAVKKKLEEENKFTIRFKDKSQSASSHYNELVFVNVSAKKDEHKAVIGFRGIDDILEVERMQYQFAHALLHECAFFYGFDVTYGELNGVFHSDSDYDPMFGENINFPVTYDEFNSIREKSLGIHVENEDDRYMWTRKGLLDAYAKGKTSLEIQYMSEKLGRYWSASILLSEEKTTGHIHAVYLVRDITKIKETERRRQHVMQFALEKAQSANEAKTRFLFNMSHDIRTPMNAIMGFTELLDKYQNEEHKRKEYINKIRDASSILISIINHVLEMAQIEKGKLPVEEKPYNLNKLSEEFSSLFAEMMERKNIDFKCTVDVEHEQILCDVDKLKKILTNLLSNAYKYTPDGGAVGCVIHEISGRSREYANCEIIVSDTGVGMSKEYIGHIFEEFSREKTSEGNNIEGTGLGMTIVKNLVQLMGGTIAVQSEQGIGTVFNVNIPVKLIYDSDAADNKKSDEELTFEGKRILIVEDNDMNAEITAEILDGFAIQTERAEDGDTAIKMVNEAPGGYYDLMLMDIQMPKMSGYEATKLIRKLSDRTKAMMPIIAFSANAFEEDRKTAIENGMDGHLAKPIDISKLKELLNMYLSDKK